MEGVGITRTARSAQPMCVSPASADESVRRARREVALRGAEEHVALLLWEVHALRRDLRAERTRAGGMAERPVHTDGHDAPALTTRR